MFKSQTFNGVKSANFFCVYVMLDPSPQDLSKLGRDLAKVCIIDNSPQSYIFHPDNAVRGHIHTHARTHTHTHARTHTHTQHAHTHTLTSALYLLRSV